MHGFPEARKSECKRWIVQEMEDIQQKRRVRFSGGYRYIRCGCADNFSPVPECTVCYANPFRARIDAVKGKIFEVFQKPATP
jgi:hypothetical protein